MSFHKITELLKSHKPVTWLFYGDSITIGSVFTFGYRNYAELFAERIRVELDRSMDIVINSAIGGDSTEELLESYDWRVKHFQPDVVFLMIGMNDCSDDRPVTLEKFHNNLEELVKKFISTKTFVVLQTTCPILPNSAPAMEPNFPYYMDVIRKFANDCKVPLIDHTKYWQKNIDHHYLWMANSFHPNQYGHRAFARLLFKNLNIFDAHSEVCKLFIP